MDQWMDQWMNDRKWMDKKTDREMNKLIDTFQNNLTTA